MSPFNPGGRSTFRWAIGGALNCLKEDVAFCRGDAPFSADSKAFSFLI
jgi:hypothetical protein